MALLIYIAEITKAICACKAYCTERLLINPCLTRFKNRMRRYSYSTQEQHATGNEIIHEPLNYGFCPAAWQRNCPHTVNLTLKALLRSSRVINFNFLMLKIRSSLGPVLSKKNYSGISRIRSYISHTFSHKTPFDLPKFR